jgi:hypothetical protein
MRIRIPGWLAVATLMASAALAEERKAVIDAYPSPPLDSSAPSTQEETEQTEPVPAIETPMTSHASSGRPLLITMIGALVLCCVLSLASSLKRRKVGATL